MEIRPATRTGVKPLIGLVGKSATGKTKSALLLARGLAGPVGKIIAVDTEFGRASMFADEIPGGYDTIELPPPFSPDRYLEAFKLAASKAAVVVVDSLSHEWNGEGGCLEMVDAFLDKRAGSDWKARDKAKFMAWAEVSPKHAALVTALTRFPCPVIACFRAKDKVRMEKGEAKEGEKSKLTVEIEYDAPIQRGDLIYEMMLSFNVEERPDGGGYFTVRKRGTESLLRAIQACGDRLSVAHGEAIAKWCAGPTALNTQEPAKPEKDRLKKKLWDLLAPVRGKGAPAMGAAEEWLRANKILPPTLSLNQLTEEDLKEAIDKTELTLNPE